MRSVEWSKASRDDLRGLDPNVARRVIAAVSRYVENGHGDVKRLAGSEGEYRLRVGDYRVRFTLPPGGMHVERVLHRREAYRD